MESLRPGGPRSRSPTHRRRWPSGSPPRRWRARPRGATPRRRSDPVSAAAMWPSVRFVSAKTVEANLARVYLNLGIRSRAELGRAPAASGSVGVAGLRGRPGLVLPSARRTSARPARNPPRSQHLKLIVNAQGRFVLRHAPRLLWSYRGIVHACYRRPRIPKHADRAESLRLSPRPACGRPHGGHRSRRPVVFLVLDPVHANVRLRGARPALTGTPRHGPSTAADEIVYRRRIVSVRPPTRMQSPSSPVSGTG